MAFDLTSYCPFERREALRASGETTGPAWIAAVTACDCVGADDADEAAEEAAAERRDHYVDSARDWDGVDDASAVGSAW